jgi:general secretion pathway protein F
MAAGYRHGGVMKLDEFAFVNQQLAGLLESGMPLAGALRELAEGSVGGDLKQELVALEKDLASGRKLSEAVADRKLPELYRQALNAGDQANDLPTVLHTLAAHYARLHAVWERVRSILVYPAIVLVFATAISIGVSVAVSRMITLFAPDFFDRNHWWYNYRSFPEDLSPARMQLET